MLAEVGYRGYGLTYRATYNILYGECATGKPFECKGQKQLPYRRHFLLKSISLIWDFAVMLNSLWLCNHHTKYITYTLLLWQPCIVEFCKWDITENRSHTVASYVIVKSRRHRLVGIYYRSKTTC